MKALWTLSLLMIILMNVSCAPYMDRRPSYDLYTDRSYRERIYNNKGEYKGYKQHTKYRTRYYDKKGRYRGYSK